MCIYYSEIISSRSGFDGRKKNVINHPKNLKTNPDFCFTASQGRHFHHRSPRQRHNNFAQSLAVNHAS